MLGTLAAHRLENRQVTQTLRSGSEGITAAIINGRASAGDRLLIVLDGILVGHTELVSMDAVTWGYLNLNDAHRGGFNTLAELEVALKRGGFRFKPLNQYELYRIQFTWLEGSRQERPSTPLGLISDALYGKAT